MRRTDLVIDGNNLRESNGITLCNGSTANVLSLPQFKAMDSDDWAEEDYLDVECSSPVFARKEFDLTIAGPETEVFEFCGLDSYRYVSLSVTGTPVDLEKCLVTGVSSYHVLRNMATATVRFVSDDNPYLILDQHSLPYFQPAPGEEEYSFVNEGGVVENFGYTGVKVLSGTHGSMERRPSSKQALTRDVSIVPCMIYDNHYGTPTSQANRVSIQCLLHTGISYNDVWNRYLYFIGRCAARGGIRIMHAGNVGAYLYSGMRVLGYVPYDDIPWIRFQIDWTRIKL